MAVDTGRRGAWVARALGARAARTALAVVVVLGLMLGVQSVKEWAQDPPEDPGPTELATWTVGGPSPTPDARSFLAAVQMGWGGRPVEPEIVVEDDWIVVTFSATVGGGPDISSFATVEVHLDEAIGDRTLVDGACLQTAESWSCRSGPIRWPQVGSVR